MLNYEFPPFGGGAGRATYYISRELVKKGLDIDVITSRYDKQNEVEEFDGVKIYRVLSKRKGIHECGVLGMATYLSFGFMKLNNLVRVKDYELTHSFFSIPTGILSFFAKKRYSIPYIVSLRGSDVPGYDPYNLKIMHNALKSLNKRVWKSANKVVALSHGLKEIVLKSAPELKIDVIYNGIDTDLFKPIKNESKNDDFFNLITVSRFLKRKGIHHLLKALSEISKDNIKLLIVGTGNYEEKLKQYTKELYLEEVVTFYGYCENKKLPELYNKCDIFVLPSLTESFGLVFAEAMACGLPVIGTTVGGIPEVVEHKEDGILIPPGDVMELKRAICRLVDDAKLRRRMGRHGMERIRKKFTWQAVANEYISIYEKILY